MKKTVKTKAKIKKASGQNIWLRTNTGKAVVGAVTVGVVAGLLLVVFGSANLPQVKKSAMLSPIPTSKVEQKQATKSAGKSLSTILTQKATESAVVITRDILPVPAVKKLPFTASAPFIYTIRNGDNLAKIGTTFCNDPRAYLYLMEINNFEDGYSLSPGDQITISCE